MNDPVPADRRARNPLITPAGFALLKRMLEHADAPAWNWTTGDRVQTEDLPALDAFRTAPAWDRDAWVDAQRSPWLRARVRPAWHEIPTMSREDLVTRLVDVVPPDADLSRLIVYDTSGTTGHALRLPHHPLAVAQNQILAERALARHGVVPAFGPDRAACINVTAHVHTAVLANVFTVWNQAGFAKVNLQPGWRVESARRFTGELAPRLLTGYPAAHAEAMAWDLPVKPAAILSTAVTLEPALRARLAAHFGCPVIDWYSTTETGPIAFSHGEGYELVAHDLFVEVVDDAGAPVPDGAWGEIAVTGGRNPYVPLLRYRTGDRGRMAAGRLLAFEGRAPVAFRATDGAPVQAVDVGRVLRDTAAFVQHELVQAADGACALRLRPIPGVAIDVGALEHGLRALLGADAALTITLDPRLGEAGKVVPYASNVSTARTAPA